MPGFDPKYKAAKCLKCGHVTELCIFVEQSIRPFHAIMDCPEPDENGICIKMEKGLLEDINQLEQAVRKLTDVQEPKNTKVCPESVVPNALTDLLKQSLDSCRGAQQRLVSWARQRNKST